MDIHAEQLNILLHAIKDIVKARQCPDWISKKLADAVKRAKEYNSNETASSQNSKTYEPDINNTNAFVIGEKVISNVENDICLYKIVDILDPIAGVILYNLEILKGNKDNPAGLIVHNIPMTLLQHIKE